MREVVSLINRVAEATYAALMGKFDPDRHSFTYGEFLALMLLSFSLDVLSIAQGSIERIPDGLGVGLVGLLAVGFGWVSRGGRYAPAFACLYIFMKVSVVFHAIGLHFVAMLPCIWSVIAVYRLTVARK